MYKTNFEMMEMEEIFLLSNTLHQLIKIKENQLNSWKNAATKKEAELKSMSKDNSQYAVIQRTSNYMLEEEKKLWREIQELNREFSYAITFSSSLHTVDPDYIEYLIEQ